MKTAKDVASEGVFDLIETSIYGVSPPIAALLAPARSLCSEEAQYLNEKKNLSSAMKGAVTKVVGQTAFYTATRSLGLLGEKGQAAGWVINGIVDTEKLFEGKWQETIRVARLSNNKYFCNNSRVANTNSNTDDENIAADIEMGSVMSR